MIKKHKILNKFVPDLEFWISYLSVLVVSNFDIRISDFVSVAPSRDEFPWRRFV